MYADVNGTELPEVQWIAAKKNTIYDSAFCISCPVETEIIIYVGCTVASLTKMFTTIVALQQLETGAISLNATVATYLPDFACTHSHFNPPASR